jgi:hypothetical protein
MMGILLYNRLKVNAKHFTVEILKKVYAVKTHQAKYYGRRPSLKATTSETLLLKSISPLKCSTINHDWFYVSKLD